MLRIYKLNGILLKTTLPLSKIYITMVERMIPPEMVEYDNEVCPGLMYVMKIR